MSKGGRAVARLPMPVAATNSGTDETNVAKGNEHTMKIEGLNHFNIATDDLERSAQFYESLGLKRGHRPEFPTNGIWLYIGAVPVLHLNDASEVGPIAWETAAVHHVGFSVTGTVDEITNRLRSARIEYDLWDPIPGVCRALYFKGPSNESIEFVMVDCYVPLAEGLSDRSLEAVANAMETE